MEAAALKVGTEVEALNVELEAPPRIRTIEDAVRPAPGTRKRRFMMVGMISFGSFFGGLFGVAFLELQLQKVDSADEVPADLGLRVVGALPILPPRANRRAAIARGGEGPTTGRPSCWNRSMRPEPCWCTRPEPSRIGW